MVTGCAGSPLKGTNCKREWLRYQYTDKFMKQNPHLVQMALALTGDTQPNTELLYPYPWKKQFQFSGEAQEASDGQMSEPNSLVADDPQITARLASGANSCVDVQGYPAAIPDRRRLPKAARPLAGGAARQPSLPRRPCGHRPALASKRAVRVLTGTMIRTDRKRRRSTDSSDSASSVELQASSTICPPTVPPPTPINWMLLQVPTLPLYEHSDFLFQILHTNCLFFASSQDRGSSSGAATFQASPWPMPRQRGRLWEGLLELTLVSGGLVPPPQQQPAAGRNSAMWRATMTGAGCGHAMYATGYCTKIWMLMWRLTNTKQICAHNFSLTEWMH
jgi:hypothetical protein